VESRPSQAPLLTITRNKQLNSVFKVAETPRSLSTTKTPGLAPPSPSSSQQQARLPAGDPEPRSGAGPGSPAARARLRRDHSHPRGRRAKPGHDAPLDEVQDELTQPDI